MLKHPSIFLKIFLGFWLVTLLSSGSVYLFSLVEKALNSTEHSLQIAEERRVLMGQALAVYGASAEDILAREGAEGVAHYSLIISGSAGIRPHFFFDQAAPMPTGHTPPEVRDAAARALRSGQREYLAHKDIFVLAVPVESKSLGRYVVAGETKLDETGLNAPALRGQTVGHAAIEESAVRRMLRRAATYLGRHGGDPLPFYLVLGVLGGVVCYLLTKHLTGPIMRLREAAGRMSEGDLSVRLGEDFARRGDEIAGLGRDFDRMAAHLEELIALHHRLLRDVAHELRSPLARLNVALELASKDATPASLERIRRESERLSSLIDQLLLLARLDQPARAVQAEHVMMGALVQEIVQDVNYEMQGRGCTVEAELYAEASVEGNPELLRQAVENVIRNAASYTAKDTAVRVIMSVEGGTDGGQVRITVRDFGPGVPEGNLPHIFRAFYRVSEARESRTGGMGVGLAIAEGALRVHNGSIHASNAPGGGLLVELRLPCARG